MSELTIEQIKLLEQNKIIPAGCPKEQVEFFNEVCKRKKLDPFTRQIHLVERKSKGYNGQWTNSYTIQAGIDGMRAIAQRNAKITSYKRWVEKREDDLYGICEIATEDRGTYKDELPFSEYVQKKGDGTINSFWAKFPQTMIKKCAEESVLRMMTPEDLSGVYGDDEMLQADEDHKPALIGTPKQITASVETKETPVEEISQENLTDKYEAMFQGKTPEEIKNIYNSLPIKDKGKEKPAYKLAMFYKSEYEKANPKVEDGITKIISQLTGKSKESDLDAIDAQIEAVKDLALRNQYLDAYKGKLTEIKSKHEVAILPF